MAVAEKEKKFEEAAGTPGPPMRDHHFWCVWRPDQTQAGSLPALSGQK